MARIKTPEKIRMGKRFIKHIIKRKDANSPFKCPKCKGDLEYLGSSNLFRFNCLNKDCDSYFM